jgi:hypothetical protein
MDISIQRESKLKIQVALAQEQSETFKSHICSLDKDLKRLLFLHSQMTVLLHYQNRKD